MVIAVRSNPIVGGCQCGTVRYEITDDPVALYVCHCRECQKQSSSAFGISVIVKRSEFRVARGEVKVWSRATDSGGTPQLCVLPRLRLAPMA
jgi:hypothetical protein